MNVEHSAKVKDLACLLEVNKDVERFTLEKVPGQEVLKRQDGEGQVIVANVPQAAHQVVQVEQGQHLWRKERSN